MSFFRGEAEMPPGSLLRMPGELGNEKTAKAKSIAASVADRAPHWAV